MAILGVHDVRFLRFPDELVLVNQALIEAIAAQIADVQPHILILHNPSEEPGNGHGETAQAALASSRAGERAPQIPEEYKMRGYPIQIYFCEMYGTTTQLTMEGMRYGNVLIDITSVVDRKVRAMDCLTSQFYPGDLARKCVEDVNGRMGLHWCIPYAEAFQPHNPSVYTHLPLNDYMLTLFSQSQLARNRIMVTDVPFEPAKPYITRVIIARAVARSNPAPMPEVATPKVRVSRNDNPRLTLAESTGGPRAAGIVAS